MPCCVTGQNQWSLTRTAPVATTRLRSQTHMRKRKRENNGKPSGRAGSSALLVDPESSDEGAVLWQMGVRRPRQAPILPRPAAFSGNNFCFMHSQPKGPGTPEFPVISSRLWKSEPLAALDPYSSALSFISNIPIICSWESSEVSPPQNSLKPNFSNVFSNSLLFHNFN